MSINTKESKVNDADYIMFYLKMKRNYPIGEYLKILNYEIIDHKDLGVADNCSTIECTLGLYDKESQEIFKYIEIFPLANDLLLKYKDEQRDLRDLFYPIIEFLIVKEDLEQGSFKKLGSSNNYWISLMESQTEKIYSNIYGGE